MAKITLGQFGSQGDAHFGASGIGSPTVGSQDYGFYSAHNAYRTSTGAWKHSRTSTIPSVRLLGSGGASSGNQGFSFDYSANVGTADITWTNLMQILPSGNVGIGTKSPGTKLNITDGGTQVAISNTYLAHLQSASNCGLAITAGSSSNNYIAFGDSDNYDEGIISYNNSTRSFAFRTADGALDDLVIDSAGNVGIGETNPSEKLEVAGTIKSISTGAAHLILNGDTNNSGDSGQVDAIIDFLGDGDPGIYGYRINTENYSGQTALNFQEYLNGTYSSRLYIDKDGNVGIGTTVPAYKLTVSGGGIQGGGKITYTKSAGSLDTTGYAVAGLTTSSNGQSAGFTFTCFGPGKYQRIVYSCYNGAGTWITKKVIDEGTNDVDVEASANGSTITFTFKANSSTQSYTPRVTVEAVGTAINSTYA